MCTQSDCLNEQIQCVAHGSSDYADAFSNLDTILISCSCSLELAIHHFRQYAPQAFNHITGSITSEAERITSCQQTHSRQPRKAFPNSEIVAKVLLVHLPQWTSTPCTYSSNPDSPPCRANQCIQLQSCQFRPQPVSFLSPIRFVLASQVSS